MQNRHCKLESKLQSSAPTARATLRIMVGGGGGDLVGDLVVAAIESSMINSRESFGLKDQ